MYYNLVDERRVNGNVVQKYVGYLGKDLHSKNEIEPDDMILYITRLMNRGISQDEIDSILKKMGIEYDTRPITKIILKTISS